LFQLKKNGTNFGTAHTVSTTEITNGKVVINVAKSDLGSSDNRTAITTTITDVAGNTSDASAILTITVDTAAPTITVKTVCTIAPNSNLAATFSETIAKGTGDIVIKESDGTIFETLDIQHANHQHWHQTKQRLCLNWQH
jgi:hypothetical protein